MVTYLVYAWFLAIEVKVLKSLFHELWIHYLFLLAAVS